MDYLGHVVNPRSLEPCSHTIDVICGLSTPSDITKIRSSFVLCNVFLLFIPSSVHIAALSNEIVKWPARRLHEPIWQIDRSLKRIQKSSYYGWSFPSGDLRADLQWILTWWLTNWVQNPLKAAGRSQGADQLLDKFSRRLRAYIWHDALKCTRCRMGSTVTRRIPWISVIYSSNATQCYQVETHPHGF